MLAGPLVRQNGNRCIFDKKSVNQNSTQEISEKLCLQRNLSKNILIETRSDKIVFLRKAVCNKFWCIFSANWPFAPYSVRLKASSAVPNNF